MVDGLSDVIQIGLQKMSDRISISTHKGMAGSPMITADLHNYPELYKVSRPRVAGISRRWG